LSGAQPVEKFEEIIDEEIVHARALISKGIPQSRVYDEIIKDGKTAPPPEKKQIAAPTKANPSRGGQYAKVTIQAFVDFQCPYCARVQETLAEVQKTYGNRVRIVFRHKPLPFHQDAPLAHQAAAEAFAQGGNAAFWKMHDKIFAAQSALDRGTLIGYASEIGLDVVAFTHAIDGAAHQQAIDDDVAVSDKADIKGTPSFVINDYFLSGSQPLKRFQKVVDLALKEAR
jgi:protein-disulfide isomerase